MSFLRMILFAAYLVGVAAMVFGVLSALSSSA